MVKMLDSGTLLKIDQSQLETVIPQVGGQVKIVNGEHTGEIGTMVGIDEKKFAVQVKLGSGQTIWKEYEEVSKLHKV